MSIQTITLPGLEQLEATSEDHLRSHSHLTHLSVNDVVFRPGHSCGSFLWLVSGSLRVQMVSAKGREIVLYRVVPGETCVITTACLVSGDDYNAEGIVEQDIEAVSIPRNVFNHLLAVSPIFRESIFASFGQRIGSMLHYVEEIAFGRMDTRLANFLLEHAIDGKLKTTHEQLGRELGTHREVISRLLKEFERKSWVELSWSQINISDQSALYRLSQDRQL